MGKCSRSMSLRYLVIGLIALGSATGLTLVPQSASARKYIQTPYGGRRPMELDLHAGFVYRGYGLATGTRFSIPVVHNGFIPALNNAVFINFGADFYLIHNPRRKEHRPALGFPVAMCWEFYFSRHWTAFGELGLNVYLDPRLFDGHGLHADAAHWVLVAVGGRFRFNDVVALVLRLGNPYSSFGVTFMF